MKLLCVDFYPASCYALLLLVGTKSRRAACYVGVVRDSGNVCKSRRLSIVINVDPSVWYLKGSSAV
jgi:hypothetical protein